MVSHTPGATLPKSGIDRKITAADYAAAFSNPSATPILQPFSGIVGRVVRCGMGETPEWLSQPSGRRLAWCMGPDGLRDMLGKSHFQALVGLGIKRERILDNLKKAMRWFLAVFPETGCRLVT